MNRREALEAFGTSLGAGVVLKEIPREPEPLFFTLTIPKDLPDQDVEPVVCFAVVKWKRMQEQVPGLGPLMVLREGFKLEPRCRETTSDAVGNRRDPADGLHLQAD